MQSCVVSALIPAAHWRAHTVPSQAWTEIEVILLSPSDKHLEQYRVMNIVWVPGNLGEVWLPFPYPLAHSN